jgi:hypothetical protein
MLNDRESLEERLLASPSSKSPPPSNQQLTTNQFIYLFGCYKRLEASKLKLDSFGMYEPGKSLIMNMCRSILSILDDIDSNGLTTLSVKFYTLIRVAYLDESVTSADENSLECFFDLLMQQFEPSEAQWTKEDDDVAKLVEDKTELNFLNHIFAHLNKNVIEVNKCEDFSNEYLKYMKVLKLLTRSKLMKYLFVLNSFLGEEVQKMDSFLWGK